MSFDDVVDGAVAPNGQFYFVKRASTGNEARLFCWDDAPLPPRRQISIATAERILICGFPDGKTLAYATSNRAIGRLYCGNLSSGPIQSRVDEGVLFWEVIDGSNTTAIFAIAPVWRNDRSVGLHAYRVGDEELWSAPDGHIDDCKILPGGWVTFIESSRDRSQERVHIKSVLRDMTSVFGPWVQAGRIVKGSASLDHNEHVLFATKEGDKFILWDNGERLPLNGRPWFSECERFVSWQEDTHWLGVTKPWRLVVSSTRWPGRTWGCENVSALRTLVHIPPNGNTPNGNTALLVDPNTKHHDHDLEVVMLDANGCQYARERVEGATGRMRRLGTQIAVEGKDEHGPTVTLFHTGHNVDVRAFPLVGRFERLAALSDGTVGGWHYANGILSVQRYPS